MSLPALKITNNLPFNRPLMGGILPFDSIPVEKGAKAGRKSYFECDYTDVTPLNSVTGQFFNSPYSGCHFWTILFSDERRVNYAFRYKLAAWIAMEIFPLKLG